MKIIAKRRRREFKTDYRRRKELLEGRKPRIIIRKTNKYIILQYVESKIAQDKARYTLTSKELLKYGWPKEVQGGLKNITACYLTGLLFGKKITKEREAILDLGLERSTKGSRIYSALKGIVDSGFKISHNKDMFPSEERIKNGKARDFFEKIKKNILSK